MGLFFSLLEMYSGQHRGVPHCGGDLSTLEELTSDLWPASSVQLINHVATSGVRIKDFVGRDGSLSGDAACGGIVVSMVEQCVCVCVFQPALCSRFL